VAVLAARRHAAARDAMADVAPDLRNPLLPFLPGTRRAWLVPLFRLTSRIRLPSAQGVIVTERRIGDPAVQVMITTPTEGHSPRAGVLWIHGGGYIVGSARLEASGTAPPAWIGVGDLDVFYDEDVDYAERLKARGVPCTLVTVPGMYHGQTRSHRNLCH
jgi:acetyl esterase/lipase